jgi:hypothetical protein
MSQSIDLNKLFSHNEFNSLYDFLQKCVTELEEVIQDEEFKVDYNSAIYINQISSLINIDDLDDSASIIIDIISSEDEIEETIEKNNNLTEDELKDKLKNSFTKKEYKKLLEDAKDLIDEVESQKEELIVIKNILRKLTPIYDLYQTEKW